LAASLAIADGGMARAGADRGWVAAVRPRRRARARNTHGPGL